MVKPFCDDFSYDRFREIIGPQLVGSRIPLCLWELAYHKQKAEIFDAGMCFQLAKVEAADEEDDDEEGASEGEKVDENEVLKKGESYENNAHKSNNNNIIIGNGEETPVQNNEDCGVVINDENIGSHVLINTVDMKPAENIWLIDHAWTFRLKDACRTLKESPDLVRRCEGLVGGHGFDVVYKNIFKKAYHYRIATESQLDEEDCWYLMDEVGSALTFANDRSDANCMIAPIFFPPTNCAYTLLWMTKEIPEGTILTVVPPSTNKFIESLIYKPDEFKEHKLIVMDTFELFEKRIRESKNKILVKSITISQGSSCVDSVNHFNSSADKQKLFWFSNDRNIIPPLEYVGKLKIFTDVPEITEFAILQNEKYEVVLLPNEASLIWLADFNTDLQNNLPRNVSFFNQFGYETLFCNKGSMASIIRAELGFVNWLPRTYDVKTEIQIFVGDYLSREERHEDNLWIVKPTSMARSMDMIISDQLPLILCATETIVPKVICKYIEHPLLLQKRKFDIRIIVACRSLFPLEIYMYEKVWPRFALEEYSLSDYDVYEKHFTVNNYQNITRMINMKHDEFVVAFNEEKGVGAWEKCLPGLMNMIREAFDAFSEIVRELNYIKRGKNKSNNMGEVMHGAIFGIDAMLTEDMQPRLLEVTFSPDCHRACQHYPLFYEQVFTTLLTGEPNGFVKL